jgi:hypothetical protein
LHAPARLRHQFGTADEAKAMPAQPARLWSSSAVSG